MEEDQITGRCAACVETNADWLERLGSILLLTPVGCFMLSSPVWLPPVMQRGRDPLTWGAPQWVTYYALLLFSTLAGLGMLCAAFHYLALRIRADDEGLHVRVLGWRTYPWHVIRCQNFVPVMQNGGEHLTFVPGDFGPNADFHPPGVRPLFWARISLRAFDFESLPPEKAQALTDCLDARISPCRVPSLPERIDFRTLPWPRGKLVRLDARGITVRARMTERRYAWATDMRSCVALCFLRALPYCREITLELFDGTTLSFDVIYPPFWSLRRPDRAVVTEFFQRFLLCMGESRKADGTDASPPRVT